MPRAFVVGLALVVLGCNAEPQLQQVVEEVSLGDLADCAQLRRQLQEQAAREMNAELDGLIASLDDGYGESSRADGAVPATLPAPSPSPAPGASDYTTTNTQEKDVDEPDFVKNDGSRIFTLHGRRLLALAAWPPTSAHIESDTAVEGEPISMLLYRDRLVVLSAVWLAGLGTPDDGGLPTPYLEPRAPSNAVRVAVLDVAGGVPRALDVQYLEGSFLAARRTGSSVRIVSLAGRRGPKLSYWPQHPQRSRGALRAALEQLRADNLRRIKASTLDDWLPRILRPTGSGALAQVERECSSYSASNVPARLAFTTVSSLELDSLTTRHSTLLNAADEVYASTRALFLAARHAWPSRPSAASVREDHTYLFQFDLAEPGRVHYVAAGGVPGHIADQFSLDEEAGYLRVATTRQTWHGWSQASSTNNVYVLQAAAGRLQRVGEIVELAPGERLYAARFEGPRGYLVTFRQVDPLFTLDLSEPRDPRLAGELHVPGFSTYLHPIGPSHLLTIGRDVSEDGRFMRGLQLQIFDVSSFANPALQHRYLLGNRSSSSEAEYDHKAFNYFGSRGLLAVPFSDWSASRPFAFLSTLEVLRATPELGITPVGSIDHADLLQGSAGPHVPGWSPQLRRSVMMDDFVYSISFGGLKVHDTRNLSRAVRTIPFPELQ